MMDVTWAPGCMLLGHLGARDARALPVQCQATAAVRAEACSDRGDRTGPTNHTIGRISRDHVVDEMDHSRAGNAIRTLDGIPERT